jgi:hypothetical protein
MSSPLFGVVVPGRPPIFEFQPIDETKAVALLPDPQSCTEVTFFMFPTTPVPPGYGAILYYAVPPFTDWVVVGSISPQKPSGIFRTNFSTNEDLRGCPVVQLGVALEP